MAQKKKASQAQSRVRVLVEMRVRRGTIPFSELSADARVKAAGFIPDTAYEPVPMAPPPDAAETGTAPDEDVVVIRGTIEKNRIGELEQHPSVRKIWSDGNVRPFLYRSG